MFYMDDRLLYKILFINKIIKSNKDEKQSEWICVVLK